LPGKTFLLIEPWTEKGQFVVGVDESNGGKKGGERATRCGDQKETITYKVSGRKGGGVLTHVRIPKKKEIPVGRKKRERLIICRS